MGHKQNLAHAVGFHQSQYAPLNQTIEDEEHKDQRTLSHHKPRGAQPHFATAASY